MNLGKSMFILPIMKDHLSWETKNVSGLFVQVSLYLCIQVSNTTKFTRGHQICVHRHRLIFEFCTIIVIVNWLRVTPFSKHYDFNPFTTCIKWHIVDIFFFWWCTILKCPDMVQNKGIEVLYTGLEWQRWVWQKIVIMWKLCMLLVQIFSKWGFEQVPYFFQIPGLVIMRHCRSGSIMVQVMACCLLSVKPSPEQKLNYGELTIGPLETNFS